jgi:hypothetical protein
MGKEDEIVNLRGMRHVVTSCGVCGVTYTVPEPKYDHMREDGGYASCPNGHQWGWSEGRRQRDALRRERDLLAQQVAQRDDEIRAQREAREAAERQARAAKGEITKLKKRASAGTCPCCNRTFSNMAAHMKTKHPEFDPKVVNLGAEKAKRA